MSIFSSKKQAEPKVINGNPIKCTVCDHDRFHTKSVQLNTSILSFFDLDWMNKNANCLICDKCRHIMWFDD